MPLDNKPTNDSPDSSSGPGKANNFSNQFAMAMELPFVLVGAVLLGGVLGYFYFSSALVVQPMVNAGWLPTWAFPATGAMFVLWTVIFGSALILARSFHGRELAIAPMECQIKYSVRARCQ